MNGPIRTGIFDSVKFDSTCVSTWIASVHQVVTIIRTTWTPQMGQNRGFLVAYRQISKYNSVGGQQ